MMSGVLNWVHPTEELKISEVEHVRAALEKKLIIEKDEFKLLEPYVKPWYPAGEKQRRTKLGQLFNCQFKEDKAATVCRVMNFERITSY
jgi:hypothetical protein